MRVVLVGARGMVGEAVYRTVPDERQTIFRFTRDDGDLRTDAGREKLIQLIDQVRPDVVINLAARVGGIVGNSTKMYEYYTDNIRINTNVIDAVIDTNTRVITLSSTCVYPVAAKIPIEESALHSGIPEDTNFGYAFAKRMMDVQLEAAKRQYGYDKYSIVYSSNLYGFFDRYGEEAHVVPALIDKFLDAVDKKLDVVTLKGTGAPYRQMTYVDDLGRALWRIAESGKNSNYNFANPVSLSISEIAKTIAYYTGYNGQIVWSKDLDGIFRKDASIEKFMKDFEYDDVRRNRFIMTPFDTGIEATVKHRKKAREL